MKKRWSMTRNFIIVQVNGKVRGRITVPANSEKDYVQENGNKKSTVLLNI